jgi:hypothetical protein
MYSLGFNDFSFNQLIELGIHNVKPQYIRELRELDYDLTLEQIVEMKIHHVTPEFVVEARSALGDEISIEKLIEMRSSGIHPRDIQGLKADGMEIEP